MKSRFWVLVKGEIQRLNKYGMITISLLVAVIWGAMLWFLNDDILSKMLPFILLLDATMMSLLYMGAEMSFEKNESTISTMLVTPARNSELILSKVFANTLHNVFSAALIIGVFVGLKGVEINYLWMIVALIVANAFFTLAGLAISYNQKDFTSMLVNVMLFAFLLLVPSVLYFFNVIKGEIWEYILLINPVQAAQELITDGFVTQNFQYDFNFFFSIGYLILGTYLLYKFYALPKFQDYAVKESGV